MEKMDGTDRGSSFSERSSLRPEYMTVGDGPLSASAAGLRATLEQDSGYGGSIAESNKASVHAPDPDYDMHQDWLPGPGFHPDPKVRQQMQASHIHQLYYNQNRAALGRQITKILETLKDLQRMNATWPAQYPMVQEAPDRHAMNVRPSLATTQSSIGNAHASSVTLGQASRPGPPRRAATTNGDDSSAESSTTAEQRAPPEPERLITPQSAQDFSVLKLNMNVQGLTQTEIAHSIRKESIASLLDGKINQSIRHLLLLRDRIEDIASKVLVTGDLNAGKSTFCNALLRRRILPVDEQPCTSIFCEVLDARENGNFEEVHAIRKTLPYNRHDERTFDVYPLAELEDVVIDNETYASCKVYVKDARAIDESLLHNGVVDISLIDAPGLNSDSIKTTAVFARQEEIDVVVFVVSAANHFTLSAKEFIWNAAHEKAYIFIVVNGFDNIRDKARCERTVLEQVAHLSPRTFKESSELVHFVSSDAIPISSPSGPGGDPDGGGPSVGASSNDGSEPRPNGQDNRVPNQPKPRDGDEDGVDDGDEKEKDKGKAKEKVKDFEQLEVSLRRFVLEKRARSKLAPAKTYLLNLLADLNLLAGVNRDVAQNEFDRVTKELEELEPAFEQSKKARVRISDDVDDHVEESCKLVYDETRAALSASLSQLSTLDLGIGYPGISGAMQYAEDIKSAMLDRVCNAVVGCEETARIKTVHSVNTIKQMGILHVGSDFDELNFNANRMFCGRRDALARQVDFGIELFDFFDLSHLWSQHEKVTGAGMALTVASIAGSRALAGYGWIDGALGAVKVMGTQNIRRLVVPGIIVGAFMTAAYILQSIPATLSPRLSARISEQLGALDYTHVNSHRIANEMRKVLRHPADRLRDRLRKSEVELGQRRENTTKIKRESETARKYFANLFRETNDSRTRVLDIDLEAATPHLSGAM